MLETRLCFTKNRVMRHKSNASQIFLMEEKLSHSDKLLQLVGWKLTCPITETLYEDRWEYTDHGFATCDKLPNHLDVSTDTHTKYCCRCSRNLIINTGKCIALGTHKQLTCKWLINTKFYGHTSEHRTMKSSSHRQCCNGSPVFWCLKYIFEEVSGIEVKLNNTRH